MVVMVLKFIHALLDVKRDNKGNTSLLLLYVFINKVNKVDVLQAQFEQKEHLVHSAVGEFVRLKCIRPIEMHDQQSASEPHITSQTRGRIGLFYWRRPLLK